jgi:hypothetical protein
MLFTRIYFHLQFINGTENSVAMEPFLHYHCLMLYLLNKKTVSIEPCDKWRWLV